MSEPHLTLSRKVENFVSGIVRFMGRFAGTVWRTVLSPRSFNLNLGRTIRKKRIVPPLTFLVVGCFFFSVIVDTYPEGWIVYFNWVWLSEEISRKIQERGGDLFSLTALVRSGFPTFLGFVAFAKIGAWVLSRRHWLRPRVFATICYAFGLHAIAFSFACFLPVFGEHALNPATSDSFISTLWQNGLSYILLILTLISAIIAFVCPVLMVTWAAQGREARRYMTHVASRGLAASPIFLIGIFLTTELGSLPARFTLGLTPIANVEFQSLSGHRFIGANPGDLSGASYGVLFHNKTTDLAYVDVSNASVDVTIVRNSGAEVGFLSEPVIAIRDQNRSPRKLIPVLPGQSQLVYIEIHWELDGSLGEPAELFPGDASWWYDDLEVVIDYSVLKGAELKQDMNFKFGNPTIYLVP